MDNKDFGTINKCVFDKNCGYAGYCIDGCVGDIKQVDVYNPYYSDRWYDGSLLACEKRRARLVIGGWIVQ